MIVRLKTGGQDIRCMRRSQIFFWVKVECQAAWLQHFFHTEKSKAMYQKVAYYGFQLNANILNIIKDRNGISQET